MINTNSEVLTKEKFENLCIAGLDIIKVFVGWDKRVMLTGCPTIILTK